jgi:hypothetical protein
MDAFNHYMREYQVEWRRGHVDTPEWGWQNGKQYEWILPHRLWEEGLWPGIRSSSACSLPAYVRDRRVRMHSGVHNLKSSWVLCANLYFPFGASEEGRSLLAGFLREYVSPGIESVEALELEYEEERTGPLHQSVLLGEEGGGRGAGQTSPDVALVVNGGRGLVLMEVKFVEHSFYPCSAHSRQGSRGRPGNPDPSRCDYAMAVLEHPAAMCHQVAWGRLYWDHLAPVIDDSRLSTLRCCPAARTGYQLFRQQALAEGIATSGKYDLVVTSVAMDERNDTLSHCLASTGIEHVRQWGDLFQGESQFSLYSHQEWIAWVRAQDPRGDWADWLTYVCSRYEYTP